MNQYKLRSLMFHSGFCNEEGGWDSRPIYDQEDNFKEFAELIVRECAGLVDTLNESYGAASTGGKFIKKHFGVEDW